MNTKLQNLKYVVLPGRFPTDKSSQDLHNKAFLFWRNFWNGVFREKNLDHQVNADDFWRQDMIGVIMHKNEIVGQLLHSFFHLDSLTAKNHSYFLKNYSEQYFDVLARKKTHTIMSMESIAVSPHWRKGLSGISLASVLVGLACEHQKLYGVDALIGPARSNFKVTQTVSELGAEVIVPNAMLYGEPADLIAIFKSKAKSHNDSEVSFLIKKLWNQREDHSQELPFILKKAG